MNVDCRHQLGWTPLHVAETQGTYVHVMGGATCTMSIYFYLHVHYNCCYLLSQLCVLCTYT